MITTLLCCLSLIVLSQEVKFEQNMYWEEIINKAKAEKKMIFVDCFATWCVPCKMMDKEVFNKDQVGTFLNEHFVNLKLQFDSTSNDNEYTKKMLSIAKNFMSEYKIRAYPTYLFFDSNGSIIAQETGAISPADVFLQKCKEIMNPDNQYYTLLNRYHRGDSSDKLVGKLLPDAVRLQDFKTAYSLHNRFVQLVDTPYTVSDIVTICGSIENSNSLGFAWLYKNMSLVNSILKDQGRAQGLVKAYINREAYDTYIKDQTKINWRAIALFLKRRAPKLSEQAMLELKIDYFRIQKDWEVFGKLKMDYYDRYERTFDHNARWFMNNEIMQIFRLCSNKETLKRASQWSKMTIYLEPGKENPAAMDTYANILYKIGNKKDALKWQQKALEIVYREKIDPKPYVENWDKMNANLPTWNN